MLEALGHRRDRAVRLAQRGHPRRPQAVEFSPPAAADRRGLSGPRAEQAFALEPIQRRVDRVNRDVPARLCVDFLPDGGAVRLLAQPENAEIKHPGGGSSTGSGDAPTSDGADDDSDAAPAPTSGGGSGGGSGGDSDGGGGVHVPNTPVTVPPLPSTSVGPVDEVLTFAQATAQCLLDGFIDNPLVNNDPFDQCVHDYMD